MLSLEFPRGYVSTTVTVLKPCYHPIGDTQGNICLNILKDKWSILYDVRTILLSMQSLLGEPDTYSPLNICWQPLEKPHSLYNVYFLV